MSVGCLFNGFAVCFKGKEKRRLMKRKTSKNVLPKLPPQVTGRIRAHAGSGLESFYSMAQRGDIESLRTTLETATEGQLRHGLEWKDESNRTPLIVAAANGHTDCMKLLIEKGANVMQVSNGRDEGTALHISVKKKLSSRIIYALLEAGSSPFVENNFSITPWEVARQCTNWTAISIFSDQGLFRRMLPIQFSSDNGLAIIRDVCILPRYEWHPVQKNLYRIGRTLSICSIGHSEHHSDSDLTGAQAEWIAEDRPDITSILLTFPSSKSTCVKGMNQQMVTQSAMKHIWIPKWSTWSLQEFIDVINQSDEPRRLKPSKGKSADEIDGRIMHWIRQLTASQCLDHNEDCEEKERLPDEVFKQSESGDDASLKSLLLKLPQHEKRRALSWEDMSGHTPLMIAAKEGHVECLRLLLEHGANVYHCSRGEDGGTALHVAVANSAPDDIIESLLLHNANPLVENSYRVTASDLTGGDRNLITHEELLFHETLNGEVSLKGRSDALESRSDLVVLIVPRYARCNRLQDLRQVSKTLHIYRAEDNRSLIEIDLFDAKAEMFGESSADSRDVLLTVPIKSILTWEWNKEDTTNEGIWNKARLQGSIGSSSTVAAGKERHSISPSKSSVSDEPESKCQAKQQPSTSGELEPKSLNKAPPDLPQPSGSRPSLERLCLICAKVPMDTGFLHEEGSKYGLSQLFKMGVAYRRHYCVCRKCAVHIMNEKGCCPRCNRTVKRIIRKKDKQTS